MPSPNAAQGRAGNTEDPTVRKKEENNPQAGPDPWDVVPAGRNLIPAGTTIHAPKEDTRWPAPTALQGDRNGNHGFNSLAISQAKACGHPASPAGKGGNRKARNTSHTRQLEDLLLEEEHGCLTLPQGLPQPCTHGGQPREQSLQHLPEQTEKATEKMSLEQDSQEATARGQSCPTAVPTPGSHCSQGQQGAETTKGVFQTKAPWLKCQHSVWVPWTRAGCDPCQPGDISHTGAGERSRLSSVVSVPPALSTCPWHTRFWQCMETFGHRMRVGGDTKRD